MNTSLCRVDDADQDRFERLMSFNRHVAHDIRAPLLVTIGAAELAQASLSHGDVEKTLHLLSVLSTRARGMLQLVSGLLALSGTSTEQIDFARVDLHEVARDAVEDARIYAGLEALPTLELAPLPSVIGSATLLRQVFVNLIGNALKFSRSCEAPAIEIGVTCVSDTAAVLFVRDNGVGLPRDNGARLFEPFARLHGSNYPGHGLGLHMVKQIIERHGGCIWALPSEPRGATFFFKLPRRRFSTTRE